MNAPVVLPAMSDAQRNGWWTLMSLHEQMPTGWAMVGGQMVHLHCAERDVFPSRPTDDADAAVDVRANSKGLTRFTAILTDMGFTPDVGHPQGYQHRWTRGDAVVDVLIPRGLRSTSPARRTVTGAPTIETYGAQQAVDRAEDVPVVVQGRTGVVRRPSLLGALVGKAAAMRNTGDAGNTRHIIDFAVLCTLVQPDDQIATAGRRDREHLTNMLGHLARSTAWVSVPGARDGVERVRAALAGVPDVPAPVKRAVPWGRAG